MLSITLTDQDVIKGDPISLFSTKNPVPMERIFLSNIDQAVAFPVETVFFYEGSKNMVLNDISEKVKRVVEEVLLVPYYFMAGRLHFNDHTKRLELLCNNAGVLFVSAKSRLSLKDLGNLAHPNPSFHRFVHRPGLNKSLANTAIFTIQVTKFECGGYAVGFVTNHAIVDGKSAIQMFQTLASISRGEQTTLIINNDRTRIQARNPPRIHFPHNEYTKTTSSQPSCFTSQHRTSPSPLVFSSSNNYTYYLFTFTSQMIALLKQQAMIKCSTFEAILAHIWRVRTVAVLDDHDQESRVLFAVDIRDKISPPLPESFSGNAVITAFACAKARDLIGRPLSYGVEMVREGRERASDERYIRSVIDWLEVYKGIPSSSGKGAFYVSAWWKLGFGEVDFGDGRPKHAGPIASGNGEFVLFLHDGKCEEGINVWIGLEKDRMDRFLSCVFHF